MCAINYTLSSINHPTVRELELDGKIHENQKEYDEYRTYVINQLGIQVFRIKNEELADISSVIAKLKAVL